MNAIEWRSDKERAAKAKELLNSPLMKEILEVLEEESPSKSGYQTVITMKPEQQSITLGAVMGWNDAVELLKSLGEPFATRQIPPADFSQNPLEDIDASEK